MSNSIQIVGSVTLGPPNGVCEGAFPAAQIAMQFGVGSSCGPCAAKAANYSSYGAPNISSSGAYVSLPGLGSGGPVTKANTLFIKAQQSVLLELTFAVPSSADLVVADIPLQGTLIAEYPDGRELKLVRVKGVSAIEYLFTGNS